MIEFCSLGREWKGTPLERRLKDGERPRDCERPPAMDPRGPHGLPKRLTAGGAR